MKVRAVILDVYNTLLAVGPPPGDAAGRWERLWAKTWGGPPSLTLAEFGARCQAIIAREHGAARAAGVPFPEIYWPAVTAEALPDLARLPVAVQNDFLYQHAQTQRALTLMPGADLLRELAASGIPLGIASNAQPYTLPEVDEALAGLGLSRVIFAPSLCFWSFEAGFSKPDPHVFRLLSARLRAFGIAPGEALMVGDRPDNDIAPARAQGWQTWQLTPDDAGADATSGGWSKLGDWLSRNNII